MLKGTVSFPGFSTDKLLDSFLFYQEVLGLEVELVNERSLHVELPEDGTLVIYQEDNHKPAAFTVLNFQVEDIVDKARGLAERGVEFLQYDVPFKTDAFGISWDKEGAYLACFKDPGGNILALVEN